MIPLKSNENVLLVVRKHWIVLLFEAFYLIPVALAPPVLFMFLWMVDIPLAVNIGGSTPALSMALLLLWFLIVWIMFYAIWTDYYLDILIVTDQKVVDITQRGLFNRELSTFRLDRIQDITGEVHGIIQTFFNYGTIHIQTAGEEREFIMRGVPGPFQVKETIFSYHKKAVERLRTMRISDDSLEKMREFYSRASE